MEENLLPLLDKNSSELDKLLKEYEYLNKTHSDLTKAIKENINTTKKFFSETDGVIESISLMTTSARQDMLALNQAMAEQIALVKSINDTMDDMSNKYHLSKEKIAEVIPLLEKRAQLEKQIADMGDINADDRSMDDVEEWFELSEALREVNQNIDKIGVGAKKMRRDFDDNANGVKQICKDHKKLKDITEQVTEAQEQYNNSMDNAAKKAQNFKKSGWYDLLTTGWNMLKNYVKKGTDKWLEIDQAGRDFGRTLGMTGEQLERHVSSIYDNYGSMAKKLGMEFKDIYKFQTGYAEATEKAVILTNTQVTTMAAMSRSTGEQAISVASKNLDVFATSADATIEYLAKGTARASLEGLNVKKFSEAFANNIKMASKYTFKEGITGIQKMTLLSQKLKFNMESIGAAMDKFSTLEGALDAGAKLQVLGGSFAQNFGNPLEAMSEALLDGEAFTKRIIDTVASSAKFNAKTGEIDLAPIDKQRLKAAAEAMGISYDELHNMATQSRKSSMISKAVSGKGLSESQEAYLTNKAQYNTATGKWHLTDVNGEMMKKDISQMSAEEIDKARGADSYEKIISSDVKGIHTLIQSKGEEELSKLEVIKGTEEAMLIAMGNLLDSLPTWFQWIVAALAGSTLLNGVGDLVSSIGGRVGRRGFSSLARRGGMRGRIGNTRAGRTWRKGNVARRQLGRKLGLTKNTAAVRSAGGGKWAQGLSKGLNGASKVGKFLGKAAGPLAVAATIGYGIYDAYNASQNYSSSKDAIMKDNTMSKKEKAQALNDAKKERNGAYGSAIGGTVGGIAGLAAGASAGAAIGGAVGSVVPVLGNIVGFVAGGLIGGLVGLGGALIGEKIGEAMTEDVSETMKEIEEGGAVDALVEEGAYEEDETEGLNDEEKQAIQVANIEKLCGNIDYKLGVISATVSHAVVANSSDVKNGGKDKISIPDMKLNVDGKITLEASTISSSFDMKNLLQNQEFQRGIEDIIKASLKKQTSGMSKETTVA